MGSKNTKEYKNILKKILKNTIFVHWSAFPKQRFKIQLSVSMIALEAYF